MNNDLPEVCVPPVPLDAAPALTPFKLADGSRPATWQTRVRLACDDRALHVRFDCADDDIWGTYTERDDPLYEQEAVEVFLAPGDTDPHRYFEFEISPRGTLFDAIVDNPTGRREDLRANTSWDCPGLVSAAGIEKSYDRWWAALVIPWRSVCSGPRPRVWRANFHRIERPRDGTPEFSCWSPTATDPPDFHRPERFGRLVIR